MFNSLPRGRYHSSFFYQLRKLVPLSFGSNKEQKLKGEFERAFANLIGRDHCYCVSSARMAMYYTFKFLNLPKESKVLIHAINIPDIVNAIIVNDLKPCFVDLDLDSQSICLESLKREAEGARALVITYLSGLLPDIQREIVDFCKEKNIIIVEDFSQFVSGGRYEGKPGTIGEISICSFSTGKPISTLIGGAIVTERDLSEFLAEETRESQPLEKKALLLKFLDLMMVTILTSRFVFNLFTMPLIQLISFVFRNYDINKLQENALASPNDNKWELAFSDYEVRRTEMPKEFRFTLSDWQYRFGLETFESSLVDNQKRAELAQLFYESVNERVRERLPLCVRNFSKNTFFHLPFYETERMDELQSFLRGKGIDTGPYSLALNSQLECFKEFAKETPKAEIIKKKSIFIPLDESFSPKQIISMAQIFNQFYS